MSIRSLRPVSLLMIYSPLPSQNHLQISYVSLFYPLVHTSELTLSNQDLVFIEEAFERLLLDYDRVFSAMGVPACLWRRTGEIYKANREFAELVGVNGYMLRDVCGSSIPPIMKCTTLIWVCCRVVCVYTNSWLRTLQSIIGRYDPRPILRGHVLIYISQKYGQVAFDSNQKAVLTSCVLRYKPVLPTYGTAAPSPSKTKALDSVDQEEGFRSCCFSFTIRRDPYGIPTLIVGNFIKC